ncbi:GTP-binding protein [Rhodococcus rhodnii]|uniref:CobW protein n=2 Tax=Rhodococcus rhodnii TaxID=38312 RepID=R7WTQ4_9NOCA|nr:GTP-binding protein [Rhodococcus rhodnii]EOM77529.1 CobW protein [Rhodococcus rhodnii LMG 5362]TXG90728.1 GTP-binding protein [Rhodococcus rhodnii]
MAGRSVPVVILAGFLGAGKTSMLNHLLRRNRGVRIGVVVNDFGAINIDSMMVAGQVDSMVSLSNGCLCCAVDTEDMDGMLDRLVRPDSDLDVVVIEASGLAEPHNMIRLVRASENPRVAYGGTVLVVDAAAFGDTLAQHPEIGRHVGLADLVVLNKTDLVSDEVVLDIRELLREFNSRAPVVPVSEGRLDAALLFDAQRPTEPSPGEQLTLDRLLAEADDADESHGAHHHLHEGYTALEFTSDAPLNPRALVSLLEDRPEGVYRAKGFVHFAVPGQTRKFEVQTVGPHIRFVSRRWDAGEERRTQLVVIGVGVDEHDVLTRLRGCVVGDEPADENAMLGVHRYTVAM